MKKLLAFIDGVYESESGNGGIGIVYRDEELSIQRLSSLKAREVKSAEEVKLLGVLKALEYAHAEGYRTVGILCDDDGVRDMLEGVTDIEDEQLLNLYFRIRVAAHKFISVTFSRVPWSLNKMAGALARKPLAASRPQPRRQQKTPATVLQLPLGFESLPTAKQTG